MRPFDTFRGSLTVGVEIEDGEARIVALKQSRGRSRVVRAVRVPFTSGEDAEMVTKLRGALAPYADSVRLTCGMPSAKVIQRILQLPPADVDTVAQMVRFEADNLLPFPAAEAEIDHAVLNGAGGPMTPVLIVAVRRKDLSHYRNLYVRAGATTHGVSANAVALANCFIQTRAAEGGAALADVGAAHTEIVLLLGSQLVLTRLAPIGVSHLQSGMAQGEWTSRLAAELCRACQAFKAAGRGNEVACLYLCGSAAEVPGLLEAIGSALKMEVRLFDPWAGRDIGADVDRSQAPLFAAATGLALPDEELRYRIDLTKREAQRVVAGRRRQARAGVLALVTVAVIAVLSFWAHTQLTTEEAELRRLENQAVQLRVQAESSKRRLRLSPMQASALLAASGEAQRHGLLALTMLRELSLHLPQQVCLTQLVYDARRSLVLRGTAASNTQVAATLTAARGFKGVGEVRLDYTNLRSAETGELYDFQLTCGLVSGEPTPARLEGSVRRRS